MVCRLDLDDAIPDHSTFSKNRHGRFRQSNAFRHVFEGVLRRCMREGLVAGEGLTIDASVIKADANRARGGPAIEWAQGDAPSRAVLEYLEALERANSSGEAEEPAEASSVPKNISLTDPAARWTAAPGGPAFYAYSTNCRDVLGEIDSNVQNRHGLPLPSELMTVRTSHRGTAVPVAALRLARDGEVPFIR